jgi:hypothetical protein
VELLWSTIASNAKVIGPSSSSATKTWSAHNGTLFETFQKTRLLLCPLLIA